MLAFSINRPSSTLKSVLIVATYLLVFVALDCLAFAFETSPSISPWYLPPGLTLALLLTFGLTYAPAAFGAVLISGLWVWGIDMPLLFIVLLALVITAGYSLTAFLLRRVLRIDRHLRGLRSMGWFVVVIFLTSGVVAALSIATFVIAGVIPPADYMAAVLDFWIGDAIGIIILTPFLLTCAIPWLEQLTQRASNRYYHATEIGWQVSGVRDAVEMAAEAGSIALVLWIAFGSPIASQSRLVYLCFLPLMWISIRHGLPRTAISILAINVGVTFASQAPDLRISNPVELQALLLTLSISGLFTGVVVSGRRQMKQNLIMLNKVGRNLSSTLDLDEVLSILLEEVKVLLDVVACSVWLIDPQTDELVCHQATGDGHDIVRGWRLAPGEGLVGWCTHHKESLIVADARADERHFSGVDDRTGLTSRAILTIPLETKERAIGVLQVVDATADRFKTSHLQLLESVTASTALAIENARLYAQAQREITRRKQAEHTLRESEKRFRLLYEDAPLGYQSLDKNEYLLDVNQAWLDLFGYADKKQVLGRWFGAFIAPHQREAFRSSFHDFKASGTAHDVEFEAIRRNGSHIILSFDGNIAYTQDGDFKQTYCIIHDITERRRLEEAHRTVVEYSLQGLAIMHADHVAFANPAIAELTGYSIPRLLSLSTEELKALIHPADRTRVWDILQRDLSGERTPGRSEFRIIRKDGQVRWVESLSNRVTYEGEPAIQLAYVDITERVHAEQALRESESRFRTLIENTIDWVWQVDEHGAYVYVSSQAEQIMGYTVPEMLGKTPFHFMTPQEAERVGAIFCQLVAKRERIVGLEDTLLDKNGHEIIFETNATPLFDQNDEFIGYMGTCRDITERKQAEEALRHRAAALNALQAAVLDLTTRHELPALLETIVRRATQLLNAPVGGLYLCDPEREQVRCVVSHNTQHDYVGTKLTYGQGAAGTVAQTREPLIVNDYQTWENRISIDEADRSFVTVVSAPMKWEDEVTGVIQVLHDVPGRRFTPFDLQILTLFANHAAIAVENAQLYKSLRAGRERLQMLSQRIVEAQEVERRRIARELHDEIGQALTAVKIKLQMAQNLLERPAHRQQLTHSIEALEHTLQGVRDLSLDLRPSLLDDLGLVPALRWYIDHQTQQAGVHAQFQADQMERRLSPDLEVTCFRIVQEALTNIIRHAQAQDISVELLRRDDEVKIVIADDGIGFDLPRALEDAAHGKSLGLLSMQERTAIADGEIEIESKPGLGTQVRVRFPLKSDPPREETMERDSSG